MKVKEWIKSSRTKLAFKGGSKVKPETTKRFRADDILEVVFTSQTAKTNNNEDAGY